MRITTLIAATLAALAVFATGYLAWSFHRFHQWPWSDYPNPLDSYCGRRWIPAGPQSRGQIVKHNADFHRAESLPGLVNTGWVWTAKPRASAGIGRCGGFTAVWVQLGPNRFESMTLSGSF